MVEKSDATASKRETASAARRETILNAAIMCFLENGYHQTGVRDIAKRAGVSLGNLYNHFPGKHGVLVEIAALERAELGTFLEILAGPDTASSILEKFVNAYGRYLAKPENVVLTIEITSEAIRQPDIGALFMSNRGELVAALASVITRGIEEGDFRVDLGPDDAAPLIIELIDASAYRTVVSDVKMRTILRGLKDFIMAAVRR